MKNIELEKSIKNVEKFIIKNENSVFINELAPKRRDFPRFIFRNSHRNKKMYFERFAKKIICFYFNGTGIFIHRKYHKQTHYSDEKLKEKMKILLFA